MAHLGLWLTTLLLCCQDIQSPKPHVRSVARPGCHRLRLGRVGTRKMDAIPAIHNKRAISNELAGCELLFPIFSSLVYCIQDMRLRSEIGQGFVSSEIKTFSQHVICSVELFFFQSWFHVRIYTHHRALACWWMATSDIGSTANHGLRGWMLKSCSHPKDD